MTPWRIALAYLVFGLLALALFAVPLWHGWRANVGTLRVFVPEDMQALPDVFNREGADAVVKALRTRTDKSGREVVAFAGPDKKILAGTLSRWPDEIPDPPGTYGQVIDPGDGSAVRVVVSRISLPGGYHLILGRQSAGLMSLEGSFWYGIAAALTILLAGGAALAWLLARRASTARYSEERYALAMQVAEEGHLDWRVTNDEFFASDQAKRILNIPLDRSYASRHELMAKVPYHPQDKPRVAASWRASLAGNDPEHELEYRILRGEATRWVRARWKIYRDRRGAAQRVIGIVNDITERKRIEDELRSRQEMLDVAQKSARMTAFEWKVGRNNGKNVWSSDLHAMFGLTPGTFDGRWRSWKSLVHPDDWGAAQEMVRRATRTGDLAGDFRVVHPDGSLHWFQAQGRMLLDAGKKPTGASGFIQDVTERKRAEEDLRKLERALRSAQRLEAIGTLAGGIAHDFNNILGAILGYGEMAMRDARKGTRLRRDLECILAAGERGRSLVDRVLAFSRTGVGERVSVHVQAVVREALDQVAASLPSNITVTRRLRAGRAAMLGDSTQVHQVVMNLVSNAVHAMPQGGVLQVGVEVVCIETERPAVVGSLMRGEYIVLRVVDTGDGIPSDVFERMFDPFFSTKEIGVGSGLGLSLVHGIVTNVDGAIDVETERGKGSTFTVYLRRSGEAPHRQGKEDVPASFPRGEGQCVLVVDDEEALVRLADETLQQLGYVPVSFTSSAAALAAFRADPGRFDAVLTDERMPGLSGSALIREIRGVRESIPMVLMSGYWGMESVDADVVVRKPLSARNLAETMARALHS